MKTVVQAPCRLFEYQDLTVISLVGTFYSYLLLVLQGGIDGKSSQLTQLSACFSIGLVARQRTKQAAIFVSERTQRQDVILLYPTVSFCLVTQFCSTSSCK